MNNYANIPAELKALKQWVVFDDKKIPHNPANNEFANVADPSTWSSYDVAVNASKNYRGIGFVFSSNDPYTFLDMDDSTNRPDVYQRQLEILNIFDSYTEVSPSGQGLHIIVRGKIPAGRRDSPTVEIYPLLRYATFTGNVYPPGQPKPIRDCQKQLTQLWESIRSEPAQQAAITNEPQKEDDVVVISRAGSAANGEIFKKLYNGQWEGDYPSQSEADLSLVNIIQFYTKNQEQIARIFRSSQLGKRAKANRPDYIQWMINKSFDQTLPPIDFDGFHNQMQMKLATVDSAIQQQAPSVISFPPGLVGEIAHFLYNAAPLPVPEIALAGAIGFMAGMCGRSYNVNQEGLNQYILLIAQSGVGKESMASGIDKIVNALKMQCPTLATTSIVGPGEITSGEALIRYINKNKSFVSILSEFGYRLQMLSDKRNFPQTTLKRIIMQLYHMGGKGRVFKPKIFSDKDKDITETLSPAFSILAETTPSTFYECVGTEIVADGFLPRFIIIEYKGERVRLNDNMLSSPPYEILSKLGSLFAHCESINSTNSPINVDQTDEVKKELSEFEEYTRTMVNKNAREDIRQLWNRAHIKAWKLSGLVAVGCNPWNPIIDMISWRWAVNIVLNDVKLFSDKFDSGEVGHSSVEIKQMEEIKRIVKEYFIMTPKQLASYGKQTLSLFDEKKIPWKYMADRLVKAGVFNLPTERIKGREALKKALGFILEDGGMRESYDRPIKDMKPAISPVYSFVVTDIDII